MMRMLLLAAAVMVVAAMNAVPAQAQATRTWVSGVGDDVNPCSRTAPCKTFAGAISKTADGGEISVLDPGGFGALSIVNRGLTISGDGTLASILAAGTQGIIINNTVAGKDVIFRNISINGVSGTPTPGLNGIRFLAGASLTLQNVNIYGFSQSCVDINISAGGPITDIVGSNLANCGGNGVSVSNTAVGQRASLKMSNSTVVHSTTGVNGVRQANMSLENVTITGSVTGIQVNTVGTPASEVNVHKSMITMNGTGAFVSLGSTGRFDDVYFAANGKALDNPGTCQTPNNNSSGGNVSANTGNACGTISKF